MNEFISKTIRILKENGLEDYATVENAEKFENLVSRMLEINKTMNLTAITDIDDIIRKHIADSLTVAGIPGEAASLLDIGCGAGFPSLPLAIVRPDLRITAIDSTAKKIAYVNETARLIGLNNVNAFSCRAEDYAHTGARASFDATVSRAVASLPILCELSLPMLKTGGVMIAMKSQRSADEIKEAGNAPQKLGGSGFEISERKIDDESRTIILCRKVATTPEQYPRPYAQIKKKPLS